MSRMLYLQCDHGVSGDMVVGSLLDAGASAEGLKDALAGLGLGGYEVRISRKLAGAMAGCDFDVVVDELHENHDHDMQWLFGGVDEAGHEHGHDHHHDHEHGHHHAHRRLADIRAIVEGSPLPDAVKATSMRIFGVIAEAEAKAHGTTVDEVHFHEVGAIDSIVDVVAAAWCLDDLGIERVATSALAEGEGHVRSAHGILSIPVPAVANIVEAHGLVLRRARRHAELVTPTGAAIVAATHTDEELPASYRIVATGLGIGKRAYDPPSTLRAMIVEEVAQAEPADGHAASDGLLWKLETEVDDCTGEALGYVLDRLYEAGAREAHYLPVFMKKGRPGYQIEILCDEAAIPDLEAILFEDTTTIGVRRYPMDRTALVRSFDEVQTPYGPIAVKRVVLPSGAERAYPEHDSVAKAAREQGVAYQDVLRAVVARA